MASTLALIVGRCGQALDGSHDGRGRATGHIAGSDGRPRGVLASEDGGGRATFSRTHAVTGHPGGPRLVDVPNWKGVAPGQANLEHGRGGARRSEQGELNGFPFVKVNDGRVLHEVGGRVTKQVGDVEAEVFVRGEGHGLEFTADPGGRTNLKVVRRREFLTV